MAKKVWTAEERKAAGDRLKAAREAKNSNTMVAEVPKPISRAASDMGMTTPANDSVITHPKGAIIPQLPDSVLLNELDDLSLNDFIKKHSDAFDANIDAMARVTRLSPAEIRDIQRDLGYGLPDGAQMKLDSGRLADLKLLETKIKHATTTPERQKYQEIMDGLKHQAENHHLADSREELLEARRQGDRATADKLEERIRLENQP